MCWSTSESAGKSERKIWHRDNSAQAWNYRTIFPSPATRWFQILMSLPGHRTQRLGHQLRVELAELISRGLKDPRIGFATVTRVDLSADLHHARVYVSVLGSAEEQAANIEGLASAAGFLRHEIGHRLALRRAPELTFVIDHGAEEGEKIEKLLEQLHKNER